MNVQQIRLIQASRGIAAFLVLLFHVSAMSYKYFQYNFLGVSDLGRSGGVDYFFVLTGFLLYTIYGSRIGSRINVVSFIWNRLLRIYPFYWIITLIVLPVYFLIPSFGYGFETNKDTIIHSLLLLPQAHGPILPVAWSLSYFVLFYALFSLLMALGRRASYVLTSVWLLLTLCNVFHVPVIGTDIEHHVYLSFLFNEVNLEFAVGCLLAHWALTHRVKHPRAALTLGCISLLLIWLNNKFGFIPFHDYLIYDIPAALVLVSLVSLPEKRSNPQWLLVLSKLGDASYSILLTHLIFISILMKITKATHMANKIGFLSNDILIVLMTLPLSFLVHKLVEKPLVNRLKAIKLFQPKNRQLQAP